MILKYIIILIDVRVHQKNVLVFPFSKKKNYYFFLHNMYMHATHIYFLNDVIS